MKYIQGRAFPAICSYPPRVITTNNLSCVLPEKNNLLLFFPIFPLVDNSTDFCILNIVCILITLACTAGIVEYPVSSRVFAFPKD